MSTSPIPLIRAAADGDDAAVKRLLASGADVNAHTPIGDTALIRAAFFGHVEVVRVLLSAGADVRARDAYDLTAYEWAVRKGFYDVARLLREHAPADISPAADSAEASPAPETAREGGGTDVPEAGGSVAAAYDQADDVGRGGTRESSREPTGRVDDGKAATGLPVRLEQAGLEEEARKRMKEQLTEEKSEEGPPRASVVAATGGESKSSYSPSPAPGESTSTPPLKRCPKCNSTYRSEILAYCARDATPLVRDDDDDPPAAGHEGGAQPWVWALVAVTLVAGIYAGHRINKYGSEVPDTPAQSSPAVRWERPVVEGALKGKEVSLPDPQFTTEAVGVTGEVTVEVKVDRQGTVIWARAVGGPQALQSAAAKAALESRFLPGLPARRAASVSGTITYSVK